MSRVIRPLSSDLTRALFAAGDQPLVLVEGVDDKSVFDTWFLDRLANITFYAMSGVEDIREFLPYALAVATRDRIYAIIDRDYSSDEEVASWRDESDPHLFILERHELENYLLEPPAIHAELRNLYGARDTPPTSGEITTHLLDLCHQLAPLIATNWILKETPGSKLFESSFPLDRIDRALLIEQIVRLTSSTEEEAETKLAEKEAVIAPLLSDLSQAHKRIKGKHLFHQAHQKYIQNSVCRGIPLDTFRYRMAERVQQTNNISQDVLDIIGHILAT